MVGVLASSAVHCGFEPRSDQTKDYKIGHALDTARLVNESSEQWGQNDG
jgi:hypothetical protein